MTYSASVADSIFSFDSIDPTPSHASAHPQKEGSTVAFSIHDTDSETPNTVPVSEITTRHIRRLASSATDFLGKKVNAAVITVPTDFSDEQKEALSKASKAAGIDVLQFISEPTAAVLAYDARPEAKVSDKIVVVADLGGTRSDIAVIASRGGMYSILSTSHDYETGGAQLDQVLIDHFAKEFIKKNKTDPRAYQRSLAKLKLEAEATKKALSIGGNASFSAESLADGIDFTSTINRLRYETLANKVFGSFSHLIKEAIRKADLDVLDIDQVLPSENVPKTRRILLIQIIGCYVRRNLPHPQNRPHPHIPLSAYHQHSLSFHYSYSTRSLLSRSPRRRHTGFSNPRIRKGGYPAIHASHGYRHASSTPCYRRARH